MKIKVNYIDQIDWFLTIYNDIIIIKFKIEQ